MSKKNSKPATSTSNTTTGPLPQFMDNIVNSIGMGQPMLNNPDLNNAIKQLFSFGEGSTTPGEIGDAEQYYKGVLGKTFDPNDVTKSSAYQAARNAIIPDVQSQFNKAGALHGGAAPTAETGALGTAFGNISEQEQNRLAQQQAGAASSLAGINQQRMNALNQAGVMGQIPIQNIMNWIKTLGGIGSTSSGTETQTPASGTDWGKAIGGVATIASSLPW